MLLNYGVYLALDPQCILGIKAEFQVQLTSILFNGGVSYDRPQQYPTIFHTFRFSSIIPTAIVGDDKNIMASTCGANLPERSTPYRTRHLWQGFVIWDSFCRRARTRGGMFIRGYSSVDVHVRTAQ